MYGVIIVIVYPIRLYLTFIKKKKKKRNKNNKHTIKWCGGGKYNNDIKREDPTIIEGSIPSSMYLVMIMSMYSITKYHQKIKNLIFEYKIIKVKYYIFIPTIKNIN